MWVGVERPKVMEIARCREIDILSVSELTRWGRSTIDLIDSLHQLQSWGVSLVAQNGLTFDLTTRHGKTIASIMATLAEFERDLLKESSVGAQIQESKLKADFCGHLLARLLRQVSRHLRAIRFRLCDAGNHPD